MEPESNKRQRDRGARGLEGSPCFLAAVRWENQIKKFAFVVVLIVLCASRGDATTSTVGDSLCVSGYVQMWATLYEELENGMPRQLGTGDEARQSASGFSIRRARLSVRSNLWSDRIAAQVGLKLEQNIALLDCYALIRFGDRLNLFLGQMKIPSTYEVGTASDELDFISRTTISRNITDWSLSRYPPGFKSVIVTKTKSNLRDLGIALRGNLWKDTVRYFVMMGNGLGANWYIGGKENEQFADTNGFGELFYAARLDVRPLNWAAVGGHCSVNHHDNMRVQGEKGAVIDLRRKSMSADMALALPYRIRASGMFAGGVIDDDVFYEDGKQDYVYSGYEMKVLGSIIEDLLEGGVRFDNYTFEINESGDRIKENRWTFGVTYRFEDVFKGQLNYVWKKTEERGEPDLKDNILFMNFQFAKR
jgi:hypothetical protein